MTAKEKSKPREMSAEETGWQGEVLQFEPHVIKAVEDITVIFERFEILPNERERLKFPIVNAYVKGMEAQAQNPTEIEEPVELREDIYLGLARKRVAVK